MNRMWEIKARPKGSLDETPATTKQTILHVMADSAGEALAKSARKLDGLEVVQVKAGARVDIA